MTERLSLLLHEAAHDLPVPPPPSELVLARGRRERRRRTTLTGLAAAAAFAVVGGSLALAAGGVGGSDAVDPATPPGLGPVYSLDDTVHLGDDVTVRVPGPVHSFHYTANGVVVRSNQAGGTSGRGPEDLTFVTPDGSTLELGQFPGGWGPATDPESPFLALAEMRGGHVTVVLRDAATGENVDRFRVPGTYTRMPWPVPPLSMSDGTVYVPTDDAVMAVDLETGDVSRAPWLEAGQVPEVVAGLQTSYADGAGVSTLTDVATGEVVLEADTGEHGHLDVSPDGRYAMAVREPTGPEEEDDGVTVHTVATGERVSVPGAPWDFGWTADGQLFSVDAEADTVTTCDPATGACAEQPAGLPEPPEPSASPTTTCRENGCMTAEVQEGMLEVRLAGRSYES